MEAVGYQFKLSAISLTTVNKITLIEPTRNKFCANRHLSVNSEVRSMLNLVIVIFKPEPKVAHVSIGKERHVHSVLVSFC